MQCPNLPQGLQADVTVLSKPALFTLTGTKYPYNQLYLSWYFSSQCLASHAYLAHAATSCLGPFLKDTVRDYRWYHCLLFFSCRMVPNLLNLGGKRNKKKKHYSKRYHIPDLICTGVALLISSELLSDTRDTSTSTSLLFSSLTVGNQLMKIHQSKKDTATVRRYMCLLNSHRAGSGGLLSISSSWQNLLFAHLTCLHRTMHAFPCPSSSQGSCVGLTHFEKPYIRGVRRKRGKQNNSSNLGLNL